MFSQLYETPGQLGFDVQVLSDKITGNKKEKSLCLISDLSACTMPTADQMAAWFAKDGWDVTLLDMAQPQHIASPCIISDKHRGWNYEKLAGNFDETNWYAPMQSLCAYHWLKQRKFDLIVFQHGFSTAYYSCVARKTGLALLDSPIVVMPDDPYAYWLELAKCLPTFVRMESEIDHMERQAVEMADGLLFTNRMALDWMVNARWRLGDRPERIAILGEDDGIVCGSWLGDKIQCAQLDFPLKAQDVRITVCMATCDRPEHLRITLEQLIQQTYQEFELVLVDSSDEAHPGIEQLRRSYEPVFKEKKWQWVHQPKQGLAAARNYGVSLAHGTHLLFIDDDNDHLPDEVAIFAGAARSGIDILTINHGVHHLSFNNLPPLAKFPSRQRQGEKEQGVALLFCGAVLPNGMIFNSFGDANALVKKEVYVSLNGRKTGALEGFEDWEFYIRASIAGHSFATLPEILYLYRNHVNGGGKNYEKMFGRMMSILRAYASDVPSYMYPWLLTAMVNFNVRFKTHPGRYPNPMARPEVAKQIVSHRAFSKSVQSTPQIAIVTTDKALRMTATTLVSLFMSNKDKMNVHVISAMTVENNRALESVTRYLGYDIHIVPYDPNDARLPLSSRLDDMPSALYATFLLPDYLPDLDRVIVLSSDMLVRRDIAPLWQTELNGTLFAATLDTIVLSQKRFKEKFEDRYFHPGVLLADLNAWRRERFTESALSRLQDSETLKSDDHLWGQTALNDAADGRWSLLPQIWNWFDNSVQPPVFPSHLPNNPNITESDNKIMADNPCICRFLPKSIWMPYGERRGIFGNELDTYEKIVENILARQASGELSDVFRGDDYDARSWTSPAMRKIAAT